MKKRLAWTGMALALAGCSAEGRETAVYLGLPWWLWLGISGLLVVAFVWWLYGSRGRTRPLPPPGMPPDPIGPKALDGHDSEVVMTPHDDLTRLAGLDATAVRALGAADIHTYERLSLTPVAEIERLLAEAGLDATAVAPQTWPGQAALAAAGKWEELAALQARLQG